VLLTFWVRCALPYVLLTELYALLQSLKRKLAARRAFVPWGGGKFVPLKLKVHCPLQLTNSTVQGCAWHGGLVWHVAWPLFCKVCIFCVQQRMSFLNWSGAAGCRHT